MDSLNIWYTVSEAQDLVKSGGLADVGKALPKALQDLGHNVSIVIPGYSIMPGIDDAEELLSTQLDYWPHTPYQVKKLELHGVLVYAIVCEQYFNRNELYAEKNHSYADNGERFAFFSSAALDCIPKLGQKPYIIHANDWHTGLVPFLLKTRYGQDARYSTMKSVLTIHNAAYQGIFAYGELSTIPELRWGGMEHLRYSETHVGMLKAGLAYADKINAVSPNYAEELKTPLGAHGLYNEFMLRGDDLTGIVNGCDYSEWDPRQDKFIPCTYTHELQSMLKGKAAAKQKLLQAAGLPLHKGKDKPVFGMVSRLAHQKGFDFLLPILEDFLQNDVLMVSMGTGDQAIAAQLREISARFPDKYTFIEDYTDEMAHLVEAGSDFFLMPSQFEACGLNQIYSMAYGTVPIVREVGGLKDTVVSVDVDPIDATGFSFQYPYAKDLLITMQRALIFYLQNSEQMREVQLRGMQRDFSWKRSAMAYTEMYRGTLGW